MVRAWVCIVAHMGGCWCYDTQKHVEDFSATAVTTPYYILGSPTGLMTSGAALMTSLNTRICHSAYALTVRQGGRSFYFVTLGNSSHFCTNCLCRLLMTKVSKLTGGLPKQPLGSLLCPLKMNRAFSYLVLSNWYLPGIDGCV